MDLALEIFFESPLADPIGKKQKGLVNAVVVVVVVVVVLVVVID